MTDCQMWARIIGTGLQLVGLAAAGIGLWNTRREFARRDPSSLLSKISHTFSEGVARLREAIVRPEKPPEPVYRDGEIGSVSGKILDPLAETVEVDPDESTEEQVQALTEVAQKHREALNDLESERRKVAVALEQVVKDIEKAGTDARENVRKLALGGLPLAVVGLAATFVGTLVAAFS